MSVSIALPVRRSGRMLLAAVIVAAGLIGVFGVERATAQPAEPAFLCVSPWTGAMLYLPGGCPGNYVELDMTSPVDACASSYTSHLRATLPGGGCAPGYYPVQIGSGSGAAVCASGYTGAVRWLAHAGQPCAGQVLEWGLGAGDGTCNNCPVAIPEQGIAIGTAPVSGLGTSITDVNVVVDISHTSIGDLEIFLESPSGTIVQIYDNECLLFQDDLVATFDDEAGSPIGTVCPPAGGTFQPTNPLSAFDTEDPTGVWTLTVNDVFVLDSGTLNDWSLVITTAP